jgi:GTP-binding protein
MMKIVDCWLEKTSFTDKDLIRDATKKVIFVGRSNVGKSSLINKLLGRKRLARTSSTPGKTVSVNYYRVHSRQNIPQRESTSEERALHLFPHR